MANNTIVSKGFFTAGAGLTDPILAEAEVKGASWDFGTYCLRFSVYNELIGT